VLAALAVVIALTGCSGHTTGATDVTGSSGQLNFVGSCALGEHCSWYVRYRQVGTSIWTNVPASPLGPVSGPVTDIPLSEQVSSLASGVHYEYQACGNSQPGKQFVCSGPDGTPDTTQKFVAAAGSTDWAQFHYTADHLGFNPWEITIGTGNVGQLTTAWTFSTPLGSASTPAVANGVVYDGQGDGNLYALPTGCATGGGTCTPLWTGNLGGPLLGGPAVAGGVVYANADGLLQAFSASGCGRSTCSPMWTSAAIGTADGFSSPSVASGMVYIGEEATAFPYDDFIYAFSATGCGQSTCTPVWSHDFANQHGVADSTPAVAGGIVYVGAADSKLYAFSASGCGSSSCGPLWTAGAGGAIKSSAAIAGGVAYVGSDDGKLYAFNAGGCGASSCSPLWTGATGGAVFSSPSVAYGEVYVGSEDHKLYAFPAGGCGASTCNPQWTGTTGNLIDTSPAVANGVVYVGSTDHKLYAFPAAGCSAASCSPLWTATTGNAIYSSPAVAGGVVYIGSTDDTLYAFGLP
jgi:outer membrane protein assembly factor BamB